MRIAHLTAGTGNFHCGNCHRDNALVKGLIALGHEAVLVPLYLPLVVDEAPAPQDGSIFAGGVNMFLQQKLGLFRRTPRWIDQIFDATGLLRWVSRFAGMTRARDLGEMTVETLRGLRGRQAKEWDRLLEWLAEFRPDVVAISNGLLAGLAVDVKDRLRCPIVCSLQGEDAFLDGLPQPWNDQAWRLLRDCTPHVDRFVGVSEYYSRVMARRMELPPQKITTVRNGIDVNAFLPAAAPPPVPTIGFLARLCVGKGLLALVEAFITLKERGRIAGLRLRIAGAKTPSDARFVHSIENRLRAAGVRESVDILPNIDFGEKVSFLQSLSVLSVPATYGESFGLYVIEALACGVPVVEPDHGAFPELIDATGGGVLYPAHDPGALAESLEKLLSSPEEAARLGQRGRESVRREFSSERMGGEFAAVCAEVSGGK